MTIYLAGKISGDPNYKEKFFKVQREIEEFMSFTVLNPAILPSEGFSYESYMRISGAMLKECEAVCFLPDWLDNSGARCEFQQAVELGKDIYITLGEGWVRHHFHKLTDDETKKILKRIYEKQKSEA